MLMVGTSAFPENKLKKLYLRADSILRSSHITKKWVG